MSGNMPKFGGGIARLMLMKGVHKARPVKKEMIRSERRGDCTVSSGPEVLTVR